MLPIKPEYAYELRNAGQRDHYPPEYRGGLAVAVASRQPIAPPATATQRDVRHAVPLEPSDSRGRFTAWLVMAVASSSREEMLSLR
jgi:hypothetical protein